MKSFSKYPLFNKCFFNEFLVSIVLSIVTDEDFRLLRKSKDFKNNSEISEPFQSFHISGPTPFMSATVKTKSNFSLSTVTTLFEKSFIVLGSPNSYRKAVLLINRWFKTNHSIVLVSSSLRPSLGQTTEAIKAPFSEWSPFLPFAISCNSIATNKHL